MVRLLHEQHPLHMLGPPLALRLCSRLPIQRNDSRNPPLHQGRNPSHHQILPHQLLAARSTHRESHLLDLQPGTIQIIQLFVFSTYPIFYGLLGWLFSLYPMIIIWWRLIYKKEWPGWNQLKLTFADLEHRPSYF